jgi:hypothetical protein
MYRRGQMQAQKPALRSNELPSVPHRLTSKVALKRPVPSPASSKQPTQVFNQPDG